MNLSDPARRSPSVSGVRRRRAGPGRAAGEAAGVRIQGLWSWFLAAVGVSCSWGAGPGAEGAARGAGVRFLERIGRRGFVCADECPYPDWCPQTNHVRGWSQGTNCRPAIRVQRRIAPVVFVSRNQLLVDSFLETNHREAIRPQPRMSPRGLVPTHQSREHSFVGTNSRPQVRSQTRIPGPGLVSGDQRPSTPRHLSLGRHPPGSAAAGRPPSGQPRRVSRLPCHVSPPPPPY